MFSSLRRWLALAIAPELKPAPPKPLDNWLATYANMAIFDNTITGTNGAGGTYRIDKRP